MSDKKQSSILDSFKEDAMNVLVESILPKVAPMIAPAQAKLKEYLGEDKFIHVRMLNDSLTVFIVDKSKGKYNISNDGVREKLEISEGAIVTVIPIENFIEQMLSGKLTS